MLRYNTDMRETIPSTPSTEIADDIRRASAGYELDAADALRSAKRDERAEEEACGRRDRRTPGSDRKHPRRRSLRPLCRELRDRHGAFVRPPVSSRLSLRRGGPLAFSDGVGRCPQLAAMTAAPTSAKREASVRSQSADVVCGVGVAEPSTARGAGSCLSSFGNRWAPRARLSWRRPRSSLGAGRVRPETSHWSSRRRDAAAVAAVPDGVVFDLFVLANVKRNPRSRDGRPGSSCGQAGLSDALSSAAGPAFCRPEHARAQRDHASIVVARAGGLRQRFLVIGHSRRWTSSPPRRSRARLCGPYAAWSQARLRRPRRDGLGEGSRGSWPRAAPPFPGTAPPDARRGCAHRGRRDLCEEMGDGRYYSRATSWPATPTATNPASGKMNCHRPERASRLAELLPPVQQSNGGSADPGKTLRRDALVPRPARPTIAPRLSCGGPCVKQQRCDNGNRQPWRTTAGSAVIAPPPPPPTESA